VRPRTGRVHGRVTCRVPLTRRPCTRPVNTSSPEKTARRGPYNGRAVYTAVYGPCIRHGRHTSTQPVYMTVYGPSVRMSSAVYMVRTRAMYGPCTRHVYGRVHVSTCLRVQGPCTRPCTGHLHGRKGPSTRRTRRCNVSCIWPCTGCIASCTRQCTGRVHGRFRPCTLAVYTAVFGRLHSAYTARILGR